MGENESDGQINIIYDDGEKEFLKMNEENLKLEALASPLNERKCVVKEER